MDRQEGLVPDLFRTGVLQPEIPVIPEVEGKQVAQERPHLLDARRRQDLVGHQLPQGHSEVCPGRSFLGPPAEIAPKKIDEHRVTGAHAPLQAAALQPEQ